MLDLLTTFCAVAETGSLNKAAELQHLSQPAITRQIQLLESQLGALLLTRSRQGVVLTPVGRAVVKHARQALASVEACRNVARAAGEAVTQLRIAAGFNVTMYTLPPVLAKFRERHPNVTIDLRPGHHRQAIDRVLAYESDLALIGYNIEVPGLKQIPIFVDEMVLASARPEKLKTGRLEDLEGATLLVMPPDSGVRRELNGVLEQRGITCNLVEFPSVETLKTALLVGMGETILPISAVKAEMEAGKVGVRHLEDWPGPVRMVRALLRAAGPLPRPAAAFLALLRRTYPRL